MNTRHDQNFTKKSLLRVLSTLGLLLGMSACTHQDDSYTQILSDKRYQLDHTTKNVVLSFHGASVRLSAFELESLSEALQPPKGQGKSSVHVTLPKKTVGLTGKRLAYLHKTLQGLGIKKKQIHESSHLKPQGDTVPLVLDIYRAIPTACLRQTGLAIDNFGCSTAKNMILMVDDPLTLFQGTPATYHNPAREVTAINNYLGTESANDESRSSKGGGGSLGQVADAGGTLMNVIGNATATAGNAIMSTVTNANNSGTSAVSGNAGNY